MAIIEQSVLAYTGQHNSNSHNNPALNKQAWLRYLDQSGLVDALKNTQLIVAGINDLPNVQTPVLANQAGLAFTKALVVEPVRLIRSIHSENAAKLIVNNSRTGSPVISKLAQGADQLAFVADSGSNQQELTALEYEQSINARTTGGDRANHQEWSLRNMAILRAEHGVELWIRDAEITGDVKLQQLLKGLRENMGILGASLVKVVVNGKEIFSDQASVKLQTFEE